MEGNRYLPLRKFTALLILMIFSCALTQQARAQSLQFNGTNEYRRVTNHATLQLRSFTIEMWNKPEGTGGKVSGRINHFTGSR